MQLLSAFGIMVLLLLSCCTLRRTLSIFYLSGLLDALEYITELIGDFLYFRFKILILPDALIPGGSS